jgi:hypothetical protein
MYAAEKWRAIVVEIRLSLIENWLTGVSECNGDFSPNNQRICLLSRTATLLVREAALLYVVSIG